jgi:hypothetical protein
MLQKFLDGKKKYSAFIITILATLIPLFVQDPETQKTFMDLVPPLAAAAAGIFYILTQGGIDKEKAKTEAATAQVALANGSAAAGAPAAAAPAQQPAAAPQPAPETPPVPFDAKAFNEDVQATVKDTYTEVNPCTLVYKARGKGQATKCQHISQALDYWQYLVDLAVYAKDWLTQETQKKFGECGWSPEAIAFNQDFSTILRSANNLNLLAKTNIAWKVKLAPFNDTLYGVGNLAGQLLSGAG